MPGVAGSALDVVAEDRDRSSVVEEICVEEVDDWDWTVHRDLELDGSF